MANLQALRAHVQNIREQFKIAVKTDAPNTDALLAALEAAKREIEIAEAEAFRAVCGVAPVGRQRH